MRDERGQTRDGRGLYIVVGAFPPPIHGFANAMLATSEILISRGYKTILIDSSRGVGTKRGHASLGLLYEVLRGVAILLAHAFSSGVLYVGLNAGWRQLADLCMILVARTLNMRIAIHHHSFAYLNRTSYLTRFTSKVAGKNAVHIVLCDGMRTLLQERYRLSNKIYCVSNAALIKLNDEASDAREVLSVGFLGAVTKEKGIHEFLAVAKSCISNREIRFDVAGNVRDRQMVQALEKLRVEGANIRYWGEVSGVSKKEFLNQVDILLFPTHYVNEAEPLVILECLAKGIIVISNQRGCIGELLNLTGAVVVETDEDFVEMAIKSIKQLQGNPEQWRQMKIAATEGYNLRRIESVRAFDRVLHELSVS